jgi:hypothetical protein
MTENSDTQHAVSLKLPPFWPEDPETWIDQVEAQFHIRKITSDETKFHYVVAALDPPTARRMRDTIRGAPDGQKYATLRKRLSDTFGLDESARANKILSMRGLGDRKPSELMDEMLALADGHAPCFLFKQIFLNQLPEPLQIPLAMMDFTDPRTFALNADKLWAAKNSCDASGSINKVLTQPKPRKTFATTGPNDEGLCFYHAKFGSEAHKCRAPCTFSGKVSAGRQ